MLFFCPIFKDNFDFSCSDEGLQDVVLPLLEEFGVVVSLGAVDADEAQFAVRGYMVGNVSRLEFADFDVVKGDVEIGFGIRDETVVRQNRDALGMGHFNGASHGGTIVRNDDEGIDP